MSSNDRCIVISTSKPIPKKGCDEDKDSQPPPEAANHSHESYAGPFTGEANWYVICVNQRLLRRNGR
jgi:hypothetical protein